MSAPPPLFDQKRNPTFAEYDALSPILMDVLATLVNEGKLGRKPETRLPPPPYWPQRKDRAPARKKKKRKRA